MSLKTELPEVFKARSLERHGLVYAETRRDHAFSMEGNISEQDFAGTTPLVISEKNHERAGSDLSFEDWGEQVRQKSIALGMSVQEQLGLRAIGFPQPVHGTKLLDLNHDMEKAHIRIPFVQRPAVDATILTRRGYASSFVPADCPISNIIDPHTGALMQIHTGYVGLQNGTIEKSLTEVKGKVEPSRSLVYISPHAQEGYVINQVNNNLVERFMADPFMANFVTIHPNGEATFDMTRATKARLAEAGFKAINIESSPDNTLTDDTLFSQSRFLTYGTNGRNGMIFGKRP